MSPLTSPDAIRGSLKQSCKICARPCPVRYVNQGIPYYYCNHCDFLQSFYWEQGRHPHVEQTTVNKLTRDRLWPAGEAEEMRRKGWELLEYIAWPLAWLSRRLHTILRHVPGYNHLVRWWIKRTTKRLLDFGCGHGISVLELRSRDHIDITGLDPYSPTKHPHIIRRPIEAAHFPANSFDAIFTVETMEHISNVRGVYAELHRILRPGGVLLVQTRRLEDPDYVAQQDKWFYLRDPKTHVSIYSVRAMKEIARRAGFRRVRFKGVRLARFTK